MGQRRREHERIAKALGFTVQYGKKHGKVYGSGGQLVAVFPISGGGRARRGARTLENYRACLMRAAREEEA